MKLKLYWINEQSVIHPPGTALCDSMHHVNKQCICEIYEPYDEAEMPTPPESTGFMLTRKKTYYEILTYPD